MAVLTRRRKAKLSQAALGDQVATHIRGEIGAAFQAIENWFEGQRAAISTDINTASSPFVFTNQQKKKMVARYMEYKFRRELV